MVVGATSVGKSKVACALARWLRTEILSVDSRKMYRGLNIGVARPPQEVLASIPHHFIGHYPLGDEVSAGRFQRDAHALLQALFARHQHVVGAGGSGFYLQALCGGLPTTLPAVPKACRDKWRGFAKKEGREGLLAFLGDRDPAYVARADVFNTQRLVRAAEIIDTTGRTYIPPSWQEEKWLFFLSLSP